MKHITNKKNIEFNYLEYFILRILKNGQKYKYLKFLKNIFILLSKYCHINYKNVPTYNRLTNNILNKRALQINSHNYTFIIKHVYKKKKWKKVLNVTQLNFNYSKEKELYKLLYYILYKLKIRTLQLRLFYLVYIFNFRFFRRLKIYKKLRRYYYFQLKNQRKFKIKHYTDFVYWGQSNILSKKIVKISLSSKIHFFLYYKNYLKKKKILKLNRKNILFKYYKSYLNINSLKGNTYFFKKKIKHLITKPLTFFKKTWKDKLLTRLKKKTKKIIKIEKYYLQKKYLTTSNFKYSKLVYFYNFL